MSPWIGALIAAVVIVAAVGMLVVVRMSAPPTEVSVGETSGRDPSSPLPQEGGLGEPKDLPGLVALVTPSTFMIECIEGLGSGFVLDTSGLTANPQRVLVTNHHVIAGCEKPGALTVTNDAGQYQGSVLAADPQMDLALISVPSLSAPPLLISDDPVIGQWAMAVGSPLGYRDSITPGIVANVAAGEAMITTNVVLGPGNSGGPLVDNQGRVLGINFAVWEDAQSIGLARSVDGLCASLLNCR